MKNKTLKNISIILALFLSLLYVAIVAGPVLLKLYIKSGIGDCQKVPVLCVIPNEEIINPTVDSQYLEGLTLYKFPDLKIYLPKTFLVAKEKIKKVYYKRARRSRGEDVAYLLYEKPYFFINLFPQSKKIGIKNDYEFFRRIMYARLGQIQSLTDAFFVIVKSVFIPDLGDNKNLKMASLTTADLKGFIVYNLTPEGNYFDCNVFNNKDEFFKIYIKDKSAQLDMPKVLAILSNINK